MNLVEHAIFFFVCNIFCFGCYVQNFVVSFAFAATFGEKFGELRYLGIF